MAEKVSTGGNVSFEYDKGYNPKLKTHQKKEIEEAYDRYYERKKREKKRRTAIIAIIVAIILFLIISFALLG